MATTIEYDIKVNDQGAIKSLGQMEDELSNINDELSQVAIGSDAFKDLTKQSQALTKELDKVNDEITGLQFEDKLMAADGAAKLFAGSLSAAVGTLGLLGVESEAFGAFEEKAASAIAVGLGIKDVSEGFMQFSTVMKKSGIAAKLFGSTTRTALIATGVGAFIVALGLVVAYWDDITKAVSKAADAFPFVGKAIDAIKGAFDSLFEAAKPILEFLGILPDAAERALIKSIAVNSEITQALERDIAIQQAAGANAKAMYDLRIQLLNAELTQLNLNLAEKEEIYAKETEILALNAAEQRRIREESADFQVRTKTESVDAIVAAGAVEVTADEKIQGEILTSREQLGKQETEIAKLTTNDKLNLASNAMGDLASILGEESKAGKAAAIAQTTIQTYQGATSAFASLAPIPIVGPVLGGIAAAAAVVAGIANIKAITAVGPPVSAPGIQQPKKPQDLGGRAMSQIPTQIGPPSGFSPETQIGDNTVRAYVVGGDVTTEQEAQAKLNAKRTLG